jgi:hypothetical protein
MPTRYLVLDVFHGILFASQCRTYPARAQSVSTHAGHNHVARIRCVIFLIYEPLPEHWSAELLNHFTVQRLAFQLKPGRLPGRCFKVRNSQIAMPRLKASRANSPISARVRCSLLREALLLSDTSSLGGLCREILCNSLPCRAASEERRQGPLPRTGMPGSSAVQPLAG